MNDLILLPEPQPSRKSPPEKETIEIVVEPREPQATQTRRSPLSALLGIAAIFGAGSYVFQHAQNAMSKQAPAPVVAKATDAGLNEAQRQIAALQTEVRDLRAKLDAVERRQPAETANAQGPAPEPPKIASAAQAAPETAASSAASAPTNPPAPPPQAATTEAQVTKVAPTPQKIVSGYRLREAFRSNALVESGRGVIDVQPGDVLPGVGRVIAILKRAGRWVVSTETGDIVGGAPGQARASTPRRRPVYREQYGYEPGPLGPPLLLPF